MRFTMGRYIQELDAEGRDRLIAATDFADGGNWFANGCGCLCGTAMGVTLDNWAEYSIASAAIARRLLGRFSVWENMGPAWRFPRAIRRFGKTRVVRAVKLRAARVQGCDPATIAALLDNPAHVGVGRG